MVDKRVLTVTEMAAELRFDRATVYRWVRKGKGPTVFRSPGGRIRIHHADFVEWARQNEFRINGGA